jgi:hypothetical protein
VVVSGAAAAEAEEAVQRWTLVLMVALTLVACASDDVKEAMDKMVGHDLRDAVARLGDPAARRDVPPLTIYTWETRSRLSFVVPETTSAGPGGMPITASMTPLSVIAECRLEIAVDSANLIKSYRFNGNPAGCGRFARALGG